jgi:hypothetical protein
MYLHTPENTHMKTLSEIAVINEHIFFSDAGYINGTPTLDVLVYETESDMDADTDNTLAVDRMIVIDDR